MSYVTFTDISAYKGLETADDQALVETLISRAESWLNRECRRPVVAESDTTRYFDAVGDHFRGNTLYVYEIGPLCAITTLTNGNSTTITAAQYTTYPKTLTGEEPTIREIKLLSNSGISWTYSSTGNFENACSITGKWGMFTTTTVPAIVKQAVIRLALYQYKVKDTDAFETVVIPDAGIVQAPSGFPVDVANIVRTLRKNH